MIRMASRSLATLFSAAVVVAGGAALIAFCMPAVAQTAVPIGTFVNPVYIAVPPDERRLVFIVERAGRIVVLRDEIAQPQPFLDIRGIVFGPPDPGSGGEQGLLSMAFAPDYATSGRFYVAFTNANGSLRVDEYRRSANQLRANPATRRLVILIPHPGAPQNHNGGQLQFGPDGYLYISTGDGGGLSPLGEPARDLESLLGKILRIDPRPTASRGYRIPPSNPFVGRPGRDEIYSYGLRNPWRFSFDGDRIAIADVGHGQWEEVNFRAVAAASRANFGWPQYEGNVVFDNDRPGAHAPRFPSLVYSHAGGRCAVIGGYVVRDPTFPALHQRYVFGDSCTGEVLSFHPADNPPVWRGEPVSFPGLTSFGLGFRGQLYAAQLSGQVFRIEPVP